MALVYTSALLPDDDQLPAQLSISLRCGQGGGNINQDSKMSIVNPQLKCYTADERRLYKHNLAILTM